MVLVPVVLVPVVLVNRRTPGYGLRVVLLVVALPVALLAVLVTGGSLARVSQHEWRWPAALWIALAVQLVVGFGRSFPRDDIAALRMLELSYVLLAVFVVRNLTQRGMAVVLAGVALNGFIITLDRGMPTRAPLHAHVIATVKHHRAGPTDRLVALGDVLVVGPVHEAASVGDLLIVAGVVIVLAYAARPARRLSVRDRHLVRLHADAAARVAALDRSVDDVVDLRAPPGGPGYTTTRSRAASTRGS